MFHGAIKKARFLWTTVYNQLNAFHQKSEGSRGSADKLLMYLGEVHRVLETYI